MPTHEILLGLILLGVFLCLAQIAVVGVSFAPWLPSENYDVRTALAAAKLRPGERFVDLGCGTGNVVLVAAREFGASARGVELAPPLYVVCRLRSMLGTHADTSFRLGNLYREDLSDADVVYLFGTPLVSRLTKKLESELKPGARVISHSFRIRGLAGELIIPLRGSREAYLYTMPSRPSSSVSPSQPAVAVEGGGDTA